MSETSSQSLKPGTLLRGKDLTYSIVRVLGSGSFGITYLATANISIGNISQTLRFAVKEHFMNTCYRGANGCDVLCTPASRQEVNESRQDFLTEANRLKKLCRKSRNIVSVNETFEAFGTAYYVMEFLDGGNPTRLPEKDAVEIIRQVADALDTIHSEKVLHLDVKPDNVVMKTDENGETYPVLIDFGVSKHFNSSGKPTSHLNAKGASEGYAPQEQYADITEFSPKYDVYALGALLLYLLSGKNPPSAFKVSPNRKELEDLIPAEVSENVRQTILAAMKPSAFDRTQCIGEFLLNLQSGAASHHGATSRMDVSSAGGSSVTQKIKPGGDGAARSWWLANRRLVAFSALAIACVAIFVLIYVFIIAGPRSSSAAALSADTLGDSVSGQPSVNNSNDVPDLVTNPVTEAVPAVAEAVPAAEEPLPLSPQSQNAAPAPEKIANAPAEEPARTSGSLSLGYATWRGGIKNGKPDGKGRLTFSAPHAVDRLSSVQANEGDYFDATYDNGTLISGKLYDSYGNLIKTIIP